MIKKVSIVMAVYNEPKSWLKKSIESLLCQTHKDFEMIIINDGSTNPETLDELDLQSKLDSRIKLFQNSNIGLTSSLNYGVSKCDTNIIFRQDADDWSDHSRIEYQLEYINNDPKLILVGSTPVFCQSNGKPIFKKSLPLDHASILKAFPKSNPFCHGSVCFRKDKFESIGGYDSRIKYSQDYDLFWRLSKIGKVINLNKPIYFLRRTGTSISSTKGNQQIIYDKLIIRKNTHKEFDSIDFNEAENEIRNISDTKLNLLRSGDEFLLAGRFLLSFKAYSKAFYSYLEVKGLLKLLRLIVWILLPLIRHKLFSTPNERYNEREK